LLTPLDSFLPSIVRPFFLPSLSVCPSSVSSSLPSLKPPSPSSPYIALLSTSAVSRPPLRLPLPLS
ncbi:hypothetical protein ACLOJK_022159, partial [Asimina triloba]